MRNEGSPEELEHRRFLAVQRLSEGYTTEEVADFLDVEPRSVRRWFAAFRQHGQVALRAQGVPGRPSKLTSTQQKIVLRWLSENPTEFGFPTELWTTARLAQLIEQEWDVSFNQRYLAAWLRYRGLSPQKPQRVARESNPKVIAAWLATEWPRIKKKARRQGASLILLDESGLLMAPLVRRTWAWKGHTPVEKERSGHREKVSVAGALWLSPRRDRLGLFYQTLVNGYFNNEYVALFLEGLLQAVRSPIIIIWDRGNMHKGDPIWDLLGAYHGRLSLELLPPYAPKLNPVEQVWSWLKYSRLCNFAPRDGHHLNERVLAELIRVYQDQERLRNFFHHSELPLPRTLLS